MRDFMIILLECSAGMSALALLYIALMPLLSKRYSEKWRYYAWLIVIIGLIIPFRPSFGNAIIKVDMSGEPAARIIDKAEYDKSKIENETAADTYKNFADNNRFNENFSFREPDIHQIEDTAFLCESVASPGEMSKTVAVFSNISLWEIVTAVWLLGVIVSLFYHTIKYLLFTKTANHWSEKIENEQTSGLFQSLKTEMKISKYVGLRSCPVIGIPILIGIIKPRILLPEIDLNRDELQFIIKHELVHYKRKDLWYKLLLMIAAVIHWFNPFVYLIIKAVGTSCERSCDAEVIRNTSMETRHNYGKTILDMARYRLKVKTLLSTHLNDGKKDMKSRLSAIMDAGRKRGGVIIAAIIVMGVLATGLVLAINTDKPVDTLKNTKSQTDEQGDEIQINYLEQLPETDKLVLYRTPINSWMIDPAINIFGEMYPDVEIEVRDFGMDDSNDYEMFLRTELPAGKGPDLLVMGNEFPDIYKTMDTGIFCDLNDFIGSDPDFGLDDCNKVVMDSGVYKGKRYLVPLAYETNILLTSEEALAAAGMSAENLKTFDGYAGEVKRYLEQYASTKALYAHGANLGYLMLFPWSGLRIIDYENKKVNVDGADFKKVMEAYKDIFAQDTTGPNPTFYVAEALKNGDILFYKTQQPFPFVTYYGEVRVESSPLYFPFPAVNGKTTAEAKYLASIPVSAPNKANAYAFLKILLSEKIQFGDVNSLLNGRYYMPVLNTVFDAMASSVSEYLEGWTYNGVLTAVSAETIRDYLDMYANVEDCQLYVYDVITELFNTYMMPYFKGDDTYDNCLNRARNWLELYISE